MRMTAFTTGGMTSTMRSSVRTIGEWAGSLGSGWAWRSPPRAPLLSPGAAPVVAAAPAGPARTGAVRPWPGTDGEGRAARALPRRALPPEGGFGRPPRTPLSLPPPLARFGGGDAAPGGVGA